MGDVERVTWENQARKKDAAQRMAAEQWNRRQQEAAEQYSRRKREAEARRQVVERTSWVTVGAAAALAGVYLAMGQLDICIGCILITLAAVWTAVNYRG